ncbi:MAG: hypothetical protein ABIL68_04490, partial [bacterium]
LHKNDFILHILEFLEEAQNDALEEKTQNLRIHEILNMDRFLKILGDQTIEVTFCHHSQPLTSWVFKLINKKVDHIKVIKGEVGGASLHFRFDLTSIEKNPNPSFVQISILLCRLLNSNKGLTRRINLMRLLVALALG